MIVDELTKLDKPKRVSIAVSVVLAVICICYFAIVRNYVASLRIAGARHARFQATYAETEKQWNGLTSLQERFDDEERQLDERRQLCFSDEQAVRFFEEISQMAITHDLKPISRIIAQPTDLLADKNNDDSPAHQPLRTQSATITLCGNYLDIVDFVNEFAARPQKLSMTDLSITLPPGERLNPKVSFKITLFIDSCQEGKQ
jgi:Tfp pilus assembly protein PilO